MTTDASCGAVIGMHDSFTPLGGLVPLFNIQTDEVIFGGVGAGLYSILIYVVVAVFIGGLMVGRTPEYVGKKIRTYRYKDGIVADERLPGEYPLRDVLAGDLSRLMKDLLAQETSRRIAEL